MDHQGRTILAKNLKELRALHGMTQEDLAGAAEIDRSYVSMMENRKFAASIDMIEKIAGALHVGIDELLRPDILDTVKARLAS
ncbi:MAG TPA: helix-turn-helix transcriptional regulator [Sphingopyxis sp.]|nr:helix-turn-helix transcriptional regulator [Sphingopyxis sp.]HMP43827.1 helix-turn-helix transcriptional regulator [Sphingopyxis sp.]HMQ18886.1 helix-turn-helix transcriptional regulator [Sphingopyxis sp.]